MRKALIISLWSVLLSQTAHAQSTYLDSLNKAFDNCVFLHDSLVVELAFAKELIAIDSISNVECNSYTSILEHQIDNYIIQIDALNSIITKQSIDIKELEKYSKKQARKGKSSTILSGVGGGFIGIVIGGIATVIYVKTR